MKSKTMANVGELSAEAKFVPLLFYHKRTWDSINHCQMKDEICRGI